MTDTTKQPMNAGRLLKGTVVSDKGDKTVVVRIQRLKKHPKYRKFYKVSEKYHAHDETNTFHVGDVVTIRETRPLSKLKRWVVVGKTEKA